MAQDRTARPERAPWDVMSLPRLPGYLTLTEAAERMNVTRQAVHGRVKSGTLRAWRTGDDKLQAILVCEADVDALPMSPQQRAKLIARGELSAGPEAGEQPEG
jgi:excisionase family DNA binding protein